MNKFNVFVLFGFAFAIAEFYALMITWFTAFFNPAHTVLVFINLEGEMVLELAILPPALILSTLAFVLYAKKVLGE